MKGRHYKDVTGSDYIECEETRSCRGICLERLRVTATFLNRSPDLDKKPDHHAHGAGVLHNDLQNSVEAEKRNTEINEKKRKVMG